jgi:hypothetical protein
MEITGNHQSILNRRARRTRSGRAGPAGIAGAGPPPSFGGALAHGRKGERGEYDYEYEQDLSRPTAAVRRHLTGAHAPAFDQPQGGPTIAVRGHLPHKGGRNASLGRQFTLVYRCSMAAKTCHPLPCFRNMGRSAKKNVSGPIPNLYLGIRIGVKGRQRANTKWHVPKNLPL